MALHGKRKEGALLDLIEPLDREEEKRSFLVWSIQVRGKKKIAYLRILSLSVMIVKA